MFNVREQLKKVHLDTSMGVNAYSCTQEESSADSKTRSGMAEACTSTSTSCKELVNWMPFIPFMGFELLAKTGPTNGKDV